MVQELAQSCAKNEFRHENTQPENELSKHGISHTTTTA